jgi:hypothetical protein
MAFPRIGGANIALSLTGAVGSRYRSPTTGLVNPMAGTTAITLQPAESWTIPSGTFIVYPGPYSSLQYLDPITGIYRVVNAAPNNPTVIDSEGGNFRLANATGTPVGALITNAGSSLTNGFGTVTITPSAGGSVWQSVVGGSINSTVAITTAGSGYLYPPQLIFSAPPAGGIPATGTCTISGGAINAVTVTNQGAGYTSAPTITLANDSRDSVGSGGVLTVNATLAGSGTLTAMYPTNMGTVLTAVPTFTFSPASTIAATAVMNFTVTGYTVGTAGVAYGNAQPFEVRSITNLTAGTRASNIAGPIADIGLVFPRPARLAGTSTAGGATTATGIVIEDAGFGLQAVPNAIITAGGGALPTTAAAGTFSVGGTTDTSWIQPI